MPILNPKNDAPPLEKPNTVRISTPAFKGITVDNRYTPAADLLIYVEGSPWVVNYYSQVLDADTPPMGQNLTLDPVYQQYKLIKGMEIRVTSPLSQSQNTEGGSMVVTGGAVFYPGLIPNVGDMFVADIGAGREGIFRVTTSSRKTIFKDSCYEVEYQLVDYTTPERLGDLSAKTVQTLQFIKDFLTYGQNPLVVEEVFAQGQQLVELYARLLNRYLRQFVSNEYMTLILPQQTYRVYDHFLTKAFRSCFSALEYPLIRKIRALNCDEDDPLITGSSLWDAILTRDPDILKYCFKQVGLTGVRNFTRDPMLEGVYHSGMEYVVYPKDDVSGVNYSVDFLRKVLSPVQLDPTPAGVTDLAALLGQAGQLPEQLDSTPIINQVLADDYYVLSQAFYEGATTGQSLLELCVWRYLKNEAQNMGTLKALATSSIAWGALEQFYYVPVLLMLIRSCIRGL